MARYEVHVCGLPPYIVPIAFPDSIVVRRGDVTVVEGAFDLEELGHRVDLLGGRVLAVFAGDSLATGGLAGPLA